MGYKDFIPSFPMLPFNQMWKHWRFCSHWVFYFRIKMFKFHFVTSLVDFEINKNTLVNGTNFIVEEARRTSLPDTGELSNPTS